MLLFAGLVLVFGLVGLVSVIGYVCLVPNAALRRAAVIGLTAVLFPLPLLIPSDPLLSGAPLVRFLAAILSVLTCWRLYDLHVGYPTHGRPPLRDYLQFMHPKAGHLVFRKIGSEPGPDRAGNIAQLRLGALELILGGAIAYALFTRIDLGHTAFALEHVGKWLALYVVFDGGTRLIAASQRLLGIDTIEIYDDPIVARTPADFWRRYNRMVGEWLFTNVYRRRAFRGRPVLAVLAAFGVSAAMHEYVFGMALLKVQGYQAAFFLSQGVAVALTARLKPTGWAAGVGIAATIAFTLVTLVFFTASVDQVLEPFGSFYAHGRPTLWAD